MTRVMWTNRHDTACAVVPGPGRWHRCAHAAAVVDIYNKGCARTERLDPWWKASEA